MNNFCGKRFLSALMGALSVLSSPVALAGGDKLGKGNLKGEVGSSASRDKNNGKLGELESNRKVKSVGDLKKVLKETGGKVVGVSPDGKGGFVAFIKTPRGMVRVLIVGVPLSVIIGLVAYYVFHGRKNGGVKGGNNEIIDEKKNVNHGGSEGVKGETLEEEGQNKENQNEEDPKISDQGMEKSEIIVENSADLFDKLFEGIKDKCNLFVKKLFEIFFDDANKVLKKQFDECGENLDEFFEVVFCKSSFIGVLWSVDGCPIMPLIRWSESLTSVTTFGKTVGYDFFGTVFKYLSGKKIVKFSENAFKEASWGDKISAVLFTFWCSVKYDLGGDSSRLKKVLEVKENLNSLRNAFAVISGYVRGRLEAAGKDYNGQKKSS